MSIDNKERKDECQIFDGGFYEVNDTFLLEIHECDEGYDFSLYNKESLHLIDGGILESKDWLEEDFTVKECLKMLDITVKEYSEVEEPMEL